MIAKLKGQIETIRETSLILDVQGVGYLVSVSGRTLASLSGVGDSIALHIEYLIRQEQPCLFGFLNTEEQGWFNLLLTVQGVGTKVALAILSAFSAKELTTIFFEQDKTTLTRAEGVGPKLAARLVSELKDKVMTTGGAAASFVRQAESTSLSEAISALCHLGYKRQEAAVAIAQASQSLGHNSPVDHLIKMGLGILSPSK